MTRTWEAVAAEVEDLARLLDAQPAEVWARTSRLPGWDVATLVAHLARGIGRVAVYAASPVDGPPERDRVSYWRYDAASLATDVDARAREAAAGQTPATLRAALRSAVAAARAAVDQQPPDTVIASVMGPITLAEFLPTRALEACVHGLDLRAALGAPLVPTAGVLASTVATLEDLLAGPRPAALADDVAFVEAATGRRAAADPRLPLLG
jgi:uncharacterized protein (TIGR03083 family)